MNILKWLPVIAKAMSTAQKFKKASGSDKLEVVLQEFEDNISVLEGSVGKEILDQKEVKLALVNAIASIKVLENSIKTAKRNLSLPEE